MPGSVKAASVDAVFTLGRYCGDIFNDPYSFFGPGRATVSGPDCTRFKRGTFAFSGGPRSCCGHCQLAQATRLWLGDRLAILLPNEADYIELVYACAWLGVIAVPLNTRLSPTELDHVLTDATPRGLIRHSSMPVPTVELPWQVVLDKEPFAVSGDSCPDPIYDPEAVLALIYTSGTTGRPKGAVLTHARILANVHHANYWIPHKEGGVYLHAAPMFHIADFPIMFAGPAFGVCQVTIPKFSPESFCETVQRERVTHTILVPTMINLLSQFPDLKKYDLSSLEVLGYGGSPMAPELIHRTKRGPAECATGSGLRID